MKSTLLSLAFLFCTSLIFGQATGNVDYKYLGVSFTIPEGWMGQETEEAYIMTSHTIAGMIIMLPHEEKHSIQEIEAYAKGGINEGPGNKLSPSGQLEKFGTSAIGGEFAGMIDWNRVKAFVIGKVNPHGQGLTIIAATSPDQFSNSYRTYASDLANSIQFSAPVASPMVQKFTNELTGTKLKYINNFGDASNGGSTEISMHLCSNGRFYYYYSSFTGANNADDLASDFDISVASNNQKERAGNWSIAPDAHGNAVLILNDDKGEVFEYDISVNQKGELYLDDTRYYRAGETEGCR